MRHHSGSEPALSIRLGGRTLLVGCDARRTTGSTTNQLDPIIDLIEARAEGLEATRYAYYLSDPGSDNARKEARYEAQAEALRGLAAELAAARVSSPASIPANDGEAMRTVRIVEMTGTMRATILEHDDWIAEMHRFDDEHGFAIEWGAGRADFTKVRLPPPPSAPGTGGTPAVDIRWAVIEDVDGNFDISIFNTEAEAEERYDQFWEERERSGPHACTFHAIAVPLRT